MSRLVHIAASPRMGESASLHIAWTFVDVYRDLHPSRRAGDGMARRAGRGATLPCRRPVAIQRPHVDHRRADFQSTYFADRLHWAGIDDIAEIRFHPTLTGDVADARLMAEAEARTVAKIF